jgi:polyphosphate glucokinase
MPRVPLPPTLVVDVGGTHLKALATGRRVPIVVPSSADLTPRQMAAHVLEATGRWTYDVVTIGLPTAVTRGRPVREPHNLGAGWVRFDYERAFRRPVRLVNDAAMQALGSYTGRRMLFLGLGTGLGTALVCDGGVVVGLEAAHLPYRDGRTYEEYVGMAGLARLGVRQWRRHVATVVELLAEAFVADYTVLGGGNVRLLDELPPRTRRGNNAHAFRGGFRVWQEGVTLE